MKYCLVIIVLFTATFNLFSESWKIEADLSFSMNQNAYSDNWAGEEKGSISWATNANLLAEKQLNTIIHNKNTLKLAFGQTHSQYVDNSGDKNWTKPDKTTDLIDFESILRFTLSAFVDPYLSGRWESQFLDQVPGLETKPLNSNKITESLGMAKVFFKEDKKEFGTRLGFSFKQYLNQREDIENTNDGGLEFIAEYKTILTGETINLNSKLNIYKALYYSESEDLEGTDYEDDWKTPRLTWENILSASLTKLINLNLYVNMIYNETDYDFEENSIDEIQFKQTLALGLTYKLL